MFTIECVQDVRRLSHVPRWTVLPTIRHQSVAEHTLNVMVLSGWLIEHYELDYDTHTAFELLMAAVEHDLDEVVTGDMPSPAKGTKNPDECDLGITAVVKLADYLDAHLFLLDEYALGNSTLSKVAGYVYGKCRAWHGAMWRLHALSGAVWRRRPKSYENEDAAFTTMMEVLSRDCHLSVHPVHRGEK